MGTISIDEAPIYTWKEDADFEARVYEAYQALTQALWKLKQCGVDAEVVSESIALIWSRIPEHQSDVV